MHKPIHPGEVLNEEFLLPNGLSIEQLASRLHVSAAEVSSIINGRRAIEAEFALRLSRFFGTSAEFWLNLQQTYELQLTKQSMGLKALSMIRPLTRDD